jgi:hypothetical protein
MESPNVPTDLPGPRERFEYCRAKSAEILAAAERATLPEVRRDLAAVAEQWAALAVHYERVANREREEEREGRKAAKGR